MPGQISDTIKAAISKARIAKGWSKSELARRVGVERQTVGDWEAGRSAPSRKRVPLVAQTLGLPQGAISGDPEHVNVALLETRDNTRLVPLIDWIDAGRGSEAVAPYPLGTGNDYIKVATVVSEGTFALQVRGRSMEPDFHEGDIIVVDPTVSPHKDDYIIAELLAGGREPGHGETTFKLYRPRGGVNGSTTFDLVPLNPEFATITVNKAQPGRIIGTIVEHHRIMRRR